MKVLERQREEGKRVDDDRHPTNLSRLSRDLSRVVEEEVRG